MYIMNYTFHSLDNESGKHKGADMYENSITECGTESKVL